MYICFIKHVNMLSKTSRYGVRAVLYIAAKTDENNLLGIKELSEVLEISTAMLSKVLQFLTKKELIESKSKKIYPIEENEHPYKALGEKETKVVREGNIVRIYMTSIRSHFSPDNIEGIKVGDEVHVHLTNLEQDFDVPHGLAIQGARNAELLVMPGQTETMVWKPQREGVYPFYCTDFCSALHQEMQGYIRVSPKGSNIPLSWSMGEPDEEE